jgi:hypothetical protein
MWIASSSWSTVRAGWRYSDSDRFDNLVITFSLLARTRQVQTLRTDAIEAEYLLVEISTTQALVWNGMCETSLVSTFRRTTGLVEEDSAVTLQEVLQDLV